MFLRHGQFHSEFDPERRGSLDRASVAGKARTPAGAHSAAFGVQQLTEGVLWVSLERGLPQLQSWSTYVYSMFSHVLWPIFVPFAILLIEASRWRRRALMVFLVAGLAVGLYLLFFIIRLRVTATVWENSIRYESPHFYIATVLVVYLLATCASPLSSSHRWVNIFGALALVFAGVAAVVEMKTFISVWCFFAAILSLILWRHFSRPMKAYRSRLATPQCVAGARNPERSR